MTAPGTIVVVRAIAPPAPTSLAGPVSYDGDLEIDAPGAALIFGMTVATPKVKQADWTGTGPDNGQRLTVRGQDGRAQTGTNANTNGASIGLEPGAPGSGGSGAAGAAGAVEIGASNEVPDAGLLRLKNPATSYGDALIVTKNVAGTHAMQVVAADGGDVMTFGDPTYVDTAVLSGHVASELWVAGARALQANTSELLLFAGMAFDGAQVTPGLAQLQKTGTGSAAGQPLVVQAQRGQVQTGSNANTDGGDVVLAGGGAGSGGSGAAGQRGGVALFASGLAMMRASVDSADTTTARLLLDTARDYFEIGCVRTAQKLSFLTDEVIHFAVEGDTISTTIYDGSDTVFTSFSNSLSWTHNGLGRIKIDDTGLGFFGHVPAAQPSRVGQVTDSTGGSTASNSGALVDVTATPTQAKINDNFAKLAAKINSLEANVIHALGLSA